MATSLKHVHMNEQKETDQLKELDKIQIPTDILPEEKTKEVFNVIYKLVKKKKGRLWLDNCCDNVLNPKTQKTERIWLLNGANSIWDSDLENILKDKSRYERARKARDIIFVDGILRVRSDDKLMIEFMDRNTNNIGKGRNGSGQFDFFRYDPQQEQKDRMEKQMIKINMVIKAKEMPIDKCRKLASFFGISFVDEIGQIKSDEGIRTELMIKADSDPITFQKHIDSKEVEVSYMVKRAIIDNKIDLGGASGNSTWSKGGGFICKVPSNRKSYEYLTELALTNSEEGRLFKEQLETLVT